MRKGIKVISIFAILMLYFNISCSRNDISINKEKAKTKFSEAVSRLTKLGGIASFEAPVNQSPFPNKDKNLTADQINQILTEVIKDLKEAANLDPNLKETYYYLGIAYTRLQKTEKAIKALEKSIKVEPARELSYIILCNLLWDRENYETAYRIASEYLKQFPDHKIKGLLLIGTNYYKQGMFKSAIEKGKEIVFMDKGSIEGHLLLATSYYYLNDKNSSEAEFRKIIEIDPKLTHTIEKLKKRLK